MIPDRSQKLVIHLDPGAVDSIPLGVMRGDLDGRILYANSMVRRLMGPRLGVGARLQDFEFAPGSEGVVEANLRRRFNHEASDYPVTIVHPDHTYVHATITGVPEYDAKGEVVGSIGFVTDKTMDHANLTIHNAISSASDWGDLLRALDGAVRDVLAFDTIGISLVSADRTGLRLAYGRPRFETKVSPAWRWWPMPAFVRADLDSTLTTRPDDVAAMFRTSPYAELAQSDEATREWLKLGYRHILRKPVMRDGRIIALVAFYRLDDRPFTQDDVDRVEQLPIAEAIHIALALENHNELEFALQLINRLGSVAESISEVGAVLVQAIREHFEWEHVSLFRVNYDNSTISMVHQSAGDNSRLPDGYSQSSSEGLLGTVVLSRKPVRTGNAPDVPGYVEGIASTNSEMCLPIPGDRVRWILNVESSLANAFAAEEQILVERLLAVAGLILDRTLAIEFNKTVLECSADGILQTTTQGQIQYVNPACADMLKRSSEELVGMHLSAFVIPEGSREGESAGYLAKLLEHDVLKPTKVRFSVGKNDEIPILLSGNALPAQIGGRVYVASDLSYQEHVQRMDALQAVFRQVASESRVPIALTMSFLEELRNQSLDATSADLVERAMAQLRRADLPLERVVRLAAAPEGQELPLHSVALGEVATKVVEELPASHRSQLSVTVPQDGLAPALAALPELEFCAASVIAFLLRMKAQRDGIAVDVRRDSGHQVLDFMLFDQSSRSPSATRLEPYSEQERDFALAQPVIRNLMERMRGSFEITQRESLCMRLFLTPAEAV
jgi:PAS domain S-box-containing protein